MRTHDPYQSLCRILFSCWILGFNNSVSVQDEDLSPMEIDLRSLVVRIEKHAQYRTSFVQRNWAWAVANQERGIVSGICILQGA